MKQEKSLKIKITEIVAWLLFAAIFWTINTQTMIADHIRNDLPYDLKALIMIEGSSGIAALIMIPFVVTWSSHFPFNSDRLFEYIARHLLGSVIFSLGHVGLMALFRELLFENYINSFISESIMTTLIYEYRKDFGAYITILLIISGYRLYREKKQLEDLTNSKHADRLLVKTRTGEKLIERQDIDWLKASANYVEIHTADREYLVRTTMAEMERRLQGASFARVHKSFIVNLNKINEIIPTESGDFRISMMNKTVIPLSRRYRDRLEDIVSI